MKLCVMEFGSYFVCMCELQHERRSCVQCPISHAARARMHGCIPTMNHDSGWRAFANARVSYSRNQLRGMLRQCVVVIDVPTEP